MNQSIIVEEKIIGTIGLMLVLNVSMDLVGWQFMIMSTRDLISIMIDV